MMFYRMISNDGRSAERNSCIDSSSLADSEMSQSNIRTDAPPQSLLKTVTKCHSSPFLDGTMDLRVLSRQFLQGKANEIVLTRMTGITLACHLRRLQTETYRSSCGRCTCTMVAQKAKPESHPSPASA